MKNCFSSSNALWTEIALSAGWIEALSLQSNLSTGEMARLDQIKRWGVANSYWRAWMGPYFCSKLKEYFTRYTSVAD